jgi:hypothetical protein
MITECYIGVRGTISNGMGKETPVTFSIYPNLGKAADGFCRVSEESNVLHELFDSGNNLHLYGEELDATILLTSEGTFRVIEAIAKK